MPNVREKKKVKIARVLNLVFSLCSPWMDGWMDIYRRMIKARFVVHIWSIAIFG